MTRTAYVPLWSGLDAEQAKAEAAKIERFMPANYAASLSGDGYGGWRVVIKGEDHAGWTLDDYAIPRLASGLIWAHEVVECPSCGGTMRVGQRECNWCSV